MKTRLPSAFPALRNFSLLLALLLSLCAAQADAEEWQKTLTAKRGNFPALRPLDAHYEFGWSGIKAAEATAKFSKGKGGKLELNITGRTTGAARALWRMDTTATSTCNGSTLKPIKLQQSEKYSRKSMDTTVNFTANGPETLRKPTPADPTPAKVKRFKFANVHDLHSALLFIRSQPLQNGQTTRLCVFPASSAYLAELRVTGREQIKVAGKKWPAIRCELKLQSIDKKMVLEPHKRFKRATAWISDDAERIPLKLEAEIFVGKVWLELDKLEFPKK